MSSVASSAGRAVLVRAAGDGVGMMSLSGFATVVTELGCSTVKVNDPLSPPVMFSPVCTVTTSPGAKCVVGVKLAPLPSECATHEPAWVPVLLPVTVIVPIAPRAAPRKLIEVAGLAYPAPGRGEPVPGADVGAAELALAFATATAEV